MEKYMLIIDAICVFIVIPSTIHIFRTDRAMNKMLKIIEEDFLKQINALTLHLSSKEALELISEVVEIPDKYYLGVNDDDILEVTLFETDNNMPNKMGSSIETFTLESYRPAELISFGIELANYIKNLG